MTRFAFEHLHQRVSVTCVNFLVRMPSHWLLALRAARRLDGIMHRALHYLQAGASTGSEADFPVIEPSRSRARFDRWESMAFWRAALQRFGAMSLPFGAMRRHSLAPHSQPLRYTRRRIVCIARVSSAQLTPLNVSLGDFPDRSFEVLAVRALESVKVVAGPLRLYSD